MLHAPSSTPRCLQFILLNLSPGDLVGMTRVSKNWKQVIEQSKRLREARVVDALPVPTTLITASNVTSIGIPQYNIDPALRLNAVLKFEHSSSRYQGLLMPTIVTEIRLLLWDLEILEQRAHEYITMPPCSRLLLQTGALSTVCTVYDREGIRIGDLRAASESLHRTHCLGDWNGRPGHTWASLIGCELV